MFRTSAVIKHVDWSIKSQHFFLPKGKNICKCFRLIKLTSLLVISALSFSSMNPSHAKYVCVQLGSGRMICAALKSIITSSVCMGRSTSHNHTSSLANANSVPVNDGLSGGVLWSSPLSIKSSPCCINCVHNEKQRSENKWMEGETGAGSRLLQE